MFKKILVLFFVSLAACTTYRGVPRAVNKPKKLQLGEVRQTPPAQQVQRENDYSSYPSYSTEETTNKLFNLEQFSVSVKQEPEVTYRSLPRVKNVEPVHYEVIQEETNVKKDDGLLRIAVILPLKTQNAQVAEDLQNAANMALFNAKNSKTILQFYNSNGTYDDARKKAEMAIEEGADVIVGPLFAEEVKGASKGADGVPIVSFTTDTNVLSRNVFSIGFLMEQQIKRVVEYATEKGITKFAIIVSDSESGNFVRNNFKKYVSLYNADVVADVKYTNKKTELMNAVKEISNFESRTKEYKEYKQSVKDRLKYLTNLREINPSEYLNAYGREEYLSTDDEVSFLEKTADELEKKTTISDPEYEAIFIFGDDINDVLMIGSSLMYYDVHPDRVKYLGTSQFENPKIYTERAFRNAWYPSVSTKYSGKFNAAYQKYFGRQPIKIASLAYDAVSLINSIAKDGVVSKDDLLNPNGWTGINGIFRFKSNGVSERNMDIKEVVGGSVTKTKVISPAPLNFMN